MKNKWKTTVLVVALWIILLQAYILPIVIAADYVAGTPDDTLGVWLYSAGTTVPGGAPTDDIIGKAIFYDLLEYIGDTPVEVYAFGWGPIQPTTGQEDKTIGEVVTGLSAIDDFGMHANAGDDDANFDTGADGFFLGGFDPASTLVIESDGIPATGTLGPSEASTKTQAEAALDGCEIFIFEDAELSGMIVTLSNSLGLSITFSIADLQINPPTENYADDTLIAIDLDTLAGFDDTFIDTIRIEDDSIPQAPPPPDRGDTTLEIDAIAVRESCIEVCIPYVPNPQRLWTTDIYGLMEIDDFPICNPVYLKTADDYVGHPLVPGKYQIWAFEGNIKPKNGDLIPDDYGTPVGLTPINVTTNSEGRFDVIKIWDIPCDPTLICHNFTIILDQLEVGLGVDAEEAPRIGIWGIEDYRDDLCTRQPTPPSFHVIPEVVLGTIMVLVGMFGSLGVYFVRKRRQSF